MNHRETRCRVGKGRKYFFPQRIGFRLRIPLWIFIWLCLPAAGIRADIPIGDLLIRADEAVDAHPEDPRTYWRRAEVRREAGDLPGALMDIEKAGELAPAASATAILKARVALDSGHALAALEFLAPVVEKSGNPLEAERLYAEALLRLDRPLEAAAAFSRTINEHPQPTPSLYLQRARALMAAGEEYGDRALAGLDQGMTELGPIVSLAREAIEIELASRHYEGALKRLSAASEGAHRSEHWLEWRGRILESAGRDREAREAYEEARRALGRVSMARRSSRAMRALETRLRQALDGLAKKEEKGEGS